MNKLKTNLLFLLAATTILSACEKQESKPEVGASSGKQNLNLEETDWTTRSEQINDTVLVQSKVLTSEGREKSQKEVRESSLESLNLPSTTNATAFTVRSKGNTNAKAVFVAPKLYFYRKLDGASVLPRKVGKSVVIPMHAILVDGFSDQIPKADGLTSMPLPDTYKVNLPALKSELAARGYGDSTSVGPLDGCAKLFTITVGGQTYDVTPENITKSDFCEINRPFTLNLVVPEEKADFIINEAFYRNEMDGTASFQVYVGYIDADTHIQLDRSKVYEKLEASLQGQYPPYAKAEISAKLKSIIQNETMNVFIKGDRTEIINQLIQMAYNSFVEPFELKAGPDAPKPDCSATAACVSLNYEKNKEQRTLEVNFQQYSTTLTEKTITSFGKPQQILFPEVAFKSAEDNEGSFVDNRDDHQNERNLAVTVNQGTVVELSMLGFRQQLDNVGVQVSANTWNRCGSYDWTKRCEWHENHLDVTRTYAGVQLSKLLPFSGAIVGNPGQELSFRFTRADGTSTVCNLSQLNASADATKYIVSIRNTSMCQIFSSSTNKDEIVNLSFINKLRDPNQLKQINDGTAYSRTDSYVQQDSTPDADQSPLGGKSPSHPTETVRGIQLQIEILIRKYEAKQTDRFVAE